MNAVSIIIASVIGILFIAAVCFSLKNKRKCGGDCASCHARCDKRNPLF